tara:strand:+ start:362 stop:514 length:153 start_codon:yes stop_codon:yes gene_type:complete
MSWQQESQLFECYDCEKEQYGMEFTESTGDNLVCNDCLGDQDEWEMADND